MNVNYAVPIWSSYYRREGTYFLPLIIKKQEQFPMTLLTQLPEELKHRILTYARPEVSIPLGKIMRPSPSYLLREAINLGLDVDKLLKRLHQRHRLSQRVEGSQGKEIWEQIKNAKEVNIVWNEVRVTIRTETRRSR